MNRSRLVAHSLRAIPRYKMRSGFMMLGTLIGVAVLTLVVSVGGAAQQRVLSTMRQLFGASSIIVVARGGNLLGGPRPDAARLTIDDVDAVVKALPEIEVWDPQQTMPNQSIRRAERGDTATTARVLGQSERSERVWSRGVSSGAYFDAADVTSSARVALIGRTVVRALFDREDPIGAEILVGSVPFRVVGVLERFGTDVHGMDRDNEVVVPISTLMRRLANVDSIAVAKLLVRDVTRVPEMEREVTRLLRARHGIADGQRSDFSTITAVEVQQMVNGVERVFFIYLPLVSGVALLVSAIVSAALMLSSVSERAGEIGLRRAVGARPEDIRLQFLVETAFTTLVGGALGILVCYFTVHVAAVHMRMGMGDVFSWWAVGLGVGVSIVTGLVAGVLPARRAARLDPADALR